MAALIDWVKLLLENKWLVVMVLGFLSSASTNVAQVFELDKKEEQIKATQQQVAQVAEAYRPYVVPDGKPKEVVKTKEIVRVVEKCDCDLSGLTKRIERLEKWH